MSWAVVASYHGTALTYADPQSLPRRRWVTVTCIWCYFGRRGGEKGGEVAFSGVIVLAWAACCCRRVTHCASASHVRPTGENDLDHFFLGPSHTMHRRFSSAASATIQNSAAPPSVRGLCGSAAHSYLCRLGSYTGDAWNRADPIFDA